MSFHIAIIGGGVSGLSAAYYLQQHALQTGQALAITVYECKLQFGANADTVVVNLGTYQKLAAITTLALSDATPFGACWMARS